MKIACYAAGSVGTNSYVISDDNGITAIIDCDGSPAPLYQYVEQNHLKVTHILLTHGHYDHIGSVNEVAAHFGCKIVGAAKEMPVFTDPALNCSQFVGGPIIVHPDILVSEGDKVTVGDMEFDVMETPGHTVGSICFIGKDITVLQVWKQLQQRNRLRAIIYISGRQQKSHRSQVFSDDGMDFRVQTSACFADAA